MRTIALLPLLCACTTLSFEDSDRLAAHQRNAALYFEGGKLNQAMIQVERGLELDPDDYKLNAIKGAVLLRASGDNRRQLDEATQLLERVYDWRSPMRHEPYVLLNYGLAEQKQGLRNLGESIHKADQATRASAEPTRRVKLEAEAKAHRTEATAKLRHADELLAVLVERGELLRVVHNHRLQIARQLGDDLAFEAASKAFFAQSEKDQAWVRKEVERTTTPDYEAEQFAFLQQLRQEELSVRALVADWHFDHQRFHAALAQLNRVLEIDPKRSVDYYNRGRVLVELQKREAAKADFRRFLATSTLPASSAKSTLR